MLTYQFYDLLIYASRTHHERAAQSLDITKVASLKAYVLTSRRFKRNMRLLLHTKSMSYKVCFGKNSRNIEIYRICLVNKCRIVWP